MSELWESWTHLNSVVMPLTVDLGPATGEPKDARSALDAATAVVGPEPPRSEVTELARAGLDAALRAVISHCAPRINIAPPTRWLGAKAFRQGLPPSLRSRVNVLDTRGTTWQNLHAYVSPIAHDLGAGDRAADAGSRLDHIGWSVYKLALAARAGSETLIPVQAVLKDLEALDKPKNFTRESRARVACLLGLFRQYSTEVTVPALRVIPGVRAEAIRERVDEIMEDAYLMETSFLRRTFSLNSNVASVKRDMRRLLKAVLKRRWAHGLLSLASQRLAMGRWGRSFEQLLETFGAVGGDLAPTIVDSATPFYMRGRHHMEYRRSMFKSAMEAIVTVSIAKKYVDPFIPDE